LDKSLVTVRVSSYADRQKCNLFAKNYSLIKCAMAAFHRFCSFYFCILKFLLLNFFTLVFWLSIL